MRENRTRAISRTIHKYEGTTLDRDPRDRGNWTTGVIGKGQLLGTKFGIAAHVYPHIDIPSLTEQGAIAIYVRDYWSKIAGDDLPAGIDFTAWDACVNSGSSRALTWLGKALGTDKRSPSVLAQLARISDIPATIRKANAARRSFLIALHNATYEKGWLRRVADCEATSLAWYYEATKGGEAQVAMGDEAKRASEANMANQAAASGSGIAAVATGTHASNGSLDWASIAEIGLTAAVVILTAYLAYRAYVHSQRASAMRAAAKDIGGSNAVPDHR